MGGAVHRRPVHHQTQAGRQQQRLLRVRRGPVRVRTGGILYVGPGTPEVPQHRTGRKGNE